LITANTNTTAENSKFIDRLNKPLPPIISSKCSREEVDRVKNMIQTLLDINKPCILIFDPFNIR
jgi:hypothetical protein